MKKIKFTELSIDEMSIIKGGQESGRVIIGARLYDGVCYLDVYVSDGNYTLCDQEFPEEACASYF